VNPENWKAIHFYVNTNSQENLYLYLISTALQITNDSPLALYVNLER